MLVDLHLHSTFSDGRFTPTELVQFAVKNGIGVIALTDHDSFSGLKEAHEYINKLKENNGNIKKVMIPSIIENTIIAIKLSLYTSEIGEKE